MSGKIGAIHTSAPALANQTSNAVTFGFTTDIDATVYGVLVPAGATVPDSAQVVAGTDGDDNAALAADSTSTTGGVADSLTLTQSESPPFPVADAHFVAVAP